MGPVEFKIVLLGSSHVGKTCLMERIVHDRFRENIPYQNTIGAAFAAKHFMSNGKKILVGIWDTAGSERYESMSRIYYRGAKAAIICYSVCDRSSWERAKFWFTELRAHEEDCKVYICGTKKDLVTSGLQSRELDLELTTKHAGGIQAKIMETSSKTGENVGELFQMIIDDFVISSGFQGSPDTNNDTINLSVSNRKSLFGNKFPCCGRERT